MEQDLLAHPGRQADRLGAAGVCMHRLARGVTDRPLTALRDVPPYTASAELEHALDSLDRDTGGPLRVGRDPQDPREVVAAPAGEDEATLKKISEEFASTGTY